MKAAVCGRIWALSLLVTALAGCRLPGKPGPDSVPVRPDQVTNFEALYQRNCQACHGVNGRQGMAVSLANPAYIAYAGKEHIAQATANGIGGSLMPAFASNAGGPLTDQQIQILANGVVAHWGNAATLGGAVPPPYQSSATGDSHAGEALYRADCLRCHAPGPSSILDPTYLALVSNGGLRTLLIAGKPQSGMPDWRGYPSGALNDQQLADLVAFLVSHRTPAAGQPFPNSQGGFQGDSTARETIAEATQKRLSTQAGPATGGPQVSTQAAPTANPRHPVSPKP